MGNSARLIVTHGPRRDQAEDAKVLTRTSPSDTEPDAGKNRPQRTTFAGAGPVVSGVDRHYCPRYAASTLLLLSSASVHVVPLRTDAQNGTCPGVDEY